MTARDDLAVSALARALVRTGMYVDAGIDTSAGLDKPQVYAAAILNDPDMAADGLHFVMVETLERAAPPPRDNGDGIVSGHWDETRNGAVGVVRTWHECVPDGHICAIAAPEPTGLDVERLARAMAEVWPVSFRGELADEPPESRALLMEYANRIAAEYARQPRCVPHEHSPYMDTETCVEHDHVERRAAPEPTGLDVAWAEAVEAVKQRDRADDGWAIQIAYWPGYDPSWQVTAGIEGDDHETQDVGGTPAAALRALAARLTDSGATE